MLADQEYEREMAALDARERRYCLEESIMIKLIFAIVSVIILTVFIVYSVIPAIQKVTQATERVEYTKEREKLLMSKGCIETGRDPNTNNELWRCPEGANIPPLKPATN